MMQKVFISSKESKLIADKRHKPYFLPQKQFKNTLKCVQKYSYIA